jgi:hypothetical protein
VRRVEVHNGMRTEPFRIKRLLRCLQLTCDEPARAAVRPQFVIWFVGDSTIIQLLYAFFCALIRIGGDVQQCHCQGHAHYEHPACVVHPRDWSKTTGYEWTASVEVEGTVYVLKFFPEGIFDNAGGVSLMLGGCSTDESGGHDDCPDLVIVNKGVHFKIATFERDLTAFMSKVFDLPQPVLSRTVWRETIIQHFPGDDGLYEHKQAATKCAETSNISTEAALHRQHTAHSVMLKFARARGVHPIPFVSLESIETNSGHLFPWVNGLNKQGAPNLDCTHRIYTPLYYDAVFSAFADTLCGYI